MNFPRASISCFEFRAQAAINIIGRVINNNIAFDKGRREVLERVERGSELKSVACGSSDLAWHRGRTTRGGTTNQSARVNDII